MQDHTFLTKTDLAKRWGKDTKTINEWIYQKKIKPFRGTNLFPMDYIESIERENINMEAVSAFRIRALERENQRLREENAMLKSTLFQISAMTNEATARIIKEQPESKLL